LALDRLAGTTSRENKAIAAKATLEARERAEERMAIIKDLPLEHKVSHNPGRKLA